MIRKSTHQFLLGSLLTASLVSPSDAVLTSYTNVGNGIWGVDLNWSNGVPDSIGDIAFVGSSVNAENSNVNLNANVALDGLLITDGMSVNTNGFSLGVWEPIPAAGLKIIGSNSVGDTTHHSRLIVPPINGQDDFNTTVAFKDAALEDGGKFHLQGGGLWSNGSIDIDQTSGIYGTGIVLFNSHDHFNNNGSIEAEENGELIIQSIHDDFYLNLDGDQRTGSLSALAPNSKLTLKYEDSAVIFDGGLEIGPGSEVAFEKDLLYGLAGAATLNMTSTFFQTATLSVGDGNKMIMASGSQFNATGNCLLKGRFNMAGTGTTLHVGAENAGRLTITGDSRFLEGTVKASGHLLFQGGVSESANTTYILTGGEIEAPAGTMIDLTGPDPADHLTGHGFWNAGLNNETRIQANGGTLTIDPTGSPVDWDGSGNQGKLDARNGDLHLIQPVFSTDFASYAIVGNGHTLTLEGTGWDFTPESRIVLGGDDDQGGIITSTSPLDVHGKVTVSMPSNFASPTTFHPTTKMMLEGSELLLSGGQFEISTGATIEGDGMLKTAHGSTLNTGLVAHIEPGLSNDGSLTIRKNNIGLLSVSGPFLPAGDNGVGRVVFDIKSRPDGGSYDRINVSNTVDLGGGILRIDFDVPDAQAGDVWKLISADAMTGSFDHYEINGVPEGLGLRPLVSPDGFYVKAVPQTFSYLEWANQQGLLISDLAMDADPDGDNIDNMAEMYYGGDPLEPDHDLQPAVGLATVDGQTYLTLRVYQAIHSELGFGIIMRVEESFGLENWHFAGALLLSNIYDPEHCRNILTYRSQTPVTDHQRQFLRASFQTL